MVRVGRAECVDILTVDVSCMRRIQGSWKFVFPEKTDLKETEKSNINFKLPQPKEAGTARTAAIKQFNFDFNFLKENL